MSTKKNKKKKINQFKINNSIRWNIYFNFILLNFFHIFIYTIESMLFLIKVRKIFTQILYEI